MNTAYLATVFSGFLLGAPAPKADAPKTALEKLQGTWTIVSFFDDGKLVPESKGQTIKFTDDKVIVEGEKDKKTTVKLDSSKEPHEFDFVGDDPKVLSSRILGIYVIDDDTLKISMVNNGGAMQTRDETGKLITKNLKKRPTSFDGKGALLVVLKRGNVQAKSDKEK